MRRHTILIVAIFLTMAITAPSLLALCAGPAPLEQQIDWADLIFIGTLQDITSMRVPQTILSRHGFRSIRYLKGAGSPDTLTLIQEGGTVGMTTMVLEDEPSFEIGKRYVVLAKRITDRRYPLPFYTAMGCVDHYTIEHPDSSGSSVVHRSAPLAAFDVRHMVWVGRGWERGYPLQPFDQSRGDRSVAPPRRPMTELFRLVDSVAASRIVAARGSMPDSILEREQVQQLRLYANQDPGTRVSETQFADTMRAIVARLSRLRSGSGSR